ncbi:MAG: hypothetical protein FWG73_07830 [Planctomycetaceae bacterium]|nr:hypothetical protein [Planctomycetaceae bacterium]
MSSHFRFCIDEVTQDITIGEYLEAGGMFSNAENADNSLRYFSVSIAILVGLITKTQSDTPLIEPVVIRKFQEKWEVTRDISFIERSKNRGLYSWDIGKNLPDKEQIAKMRDEAIKGGNPRIGEILISVAVSSAKKKRAEKNGDLCPVHLYTRMGSYRYSRGIMGTHKPLCPILHGSCRKI